MWSRQPWLFVKYLLDLPEFRIIFRWKPPLVEAGCSATARSSPYAVRDDCRCKQSLVPEKVGRFSFLYFLPKVVLRMTTLRDRSSLLSALLSLSRPCAMFTFVHTSHGHNVPAYKLCPCCWIYPSFYESVRIYVSVSTCPRLFVITSF